MALARDLHHNFSAAEIAAEQERLAAEAATRAARGLCPGERPSRRVAVTSLELDRFWTTLTETRVRRIAGGRYRVEVL